MVILGTNGISDFGVWVADITYEVLVFVVLESRDEHFTFSVNGMNVCRHSYRSNVKNVIGIRDSQPLLCKI